MSAPAPERPSPAARHNHVLERLLRDVPAGFSRNVDTVRFRRRQTIVEAGEPSEWLYFPIEGFASLQCVGDADDVLELAIVGTTGVIGSPVPFSAVPSPFSALAFTDLEAKRVRRDLLFAQLERAPDTRRALADTMADVVRRTIQSAYCHHAHTVSERLCRWLLLASEAVGKSVIEATHEELASVLGAARPVVTKALRELVVADAVWTQQGRVLILQPQRLVASACRC